MAIPTRPIGRPSLERERVAGPGLSRCGQRESAARLAPFRSPEVLPMTEIVPGAALTRAAHQLLPLLEQGQRIDAPALRIAMGAAFGGSDTDGAWDWKTAYDVCEGAAVLFLRKYGKALLRKAGSPAAALPSALAHPPLRRERSLPAILDADPPGLRRGDRRRDHRGRHRAGTLRRHRPARHPRRNRRGPAPSQRTGRDARRVSLVPLSGSFGHTLRCGPDRRLSGRVFPASC